MCPRRSNLISRYHAAVSPSIRRLPRCTGKAINVLATAFGGLWASRMPPTSLTPGQFLPLRRHKHYTFKATCARLEGLPQSAVTYHVLTNALGLLSFPITRVPVMYPGSSPVERRQLQQQFPALMLRRTLQPQTSDVKSSTAYPSPRIYIKRPRYPLFPEDANTTSKPTRTSFVIRRSLTFSCKPTCHLGSCTPFYGRQKDNPVRYGYISISLNFVRSCDSRDAIEN